MASQQSVLMETSRSLRTSLADQAGASDKLSDPTQPAAGISAAALEDIWRTHASQILRITQRITNNREDAEDALQDSFLRAHLYLHKFDGRSSLATWLTRIAINSALMIRRKRTNAPQQLSIDQQEDSKAGSRDLSLADRGLSPEEQYSELELRSMARRALATLRPSVRRPLELQVEERSIKEVAAAMGISVFATKSRLFHAKAALRKALAPRRRSETRSLQLSAA
jgi:RNA polymerase sigma-70 factor, ECF subfamily